MPPATLTMLCEPSLVMGSFIGHARWGIVFFMIARPWITPAFSWMKCWHDNVRDLGYDIIVTARATWWDSLQQDFALYYFGNAVFCGAVDEWTVATCTNILSLMNVPIPDNENGPSPALKCVNSKALMHALSGSTVAGSVCLCRFHPKQGLFFHSI